MQGIPQSNSTQQASCSPVVHIFDFDFGYTLGVRSIGPTTFLVYAHMTAWFTKYLPYSSPLTASLLTTLGYVLRSAFPHCDS